MVESPERTLYQFPISHFCEKTRWNIDVKGLPYVIRDLVPGLHRLTTQRAAHGGTVPVLVDRGTTVADSTAIALHLELRYPEPSLLPTEPAERARVLELEDYFDKIAGVEVRRFAYGELLTVRGAAPAAFFSKYPIAVRVAGKALGPLFAQGIKGGLRINPETVRRARTRILEAVDRLEREIHGDPSRYLVGDALSLADITAAALLGPLVAPPQSPWGALEATAGLINMRDGLHRRAAGQWVLERYRLDRERRALA